MKRFGGVASLLSGLALVCALCGCTLLMFPAIAIDDANNAAGQREVCAVLLELSVGMAPPAGLEAWLAKHKGVAALQTDDYGNSYIAFRNSLCGSEAALQEGRVTAITAKCLKTSCSYGHLQSVDCSWMEPLLARE